MKLNIKFLYTFIFFLVTFSLIYFLYYKSNYYAKSNFVVKNISILGTNSRVQSEIKASLSKLLYVKMFKVDIYKVKAKVLENSRVYTASVIKVYPDTISIKVIEKNPFFIWQNNNDEFYVVSSENKIVRKAKLEDYNTLILVKGENLPICASNEVRFYIYGNNLLLNKVSVIQYKGYRWNLVLKNGIVIKLPESNLQSAINLIVNMDKKYQILSRKIKYIDATVQKKLFIKPE